MAERLDRETFDAFVADSVLPVLVDFYRDGCIPCRRTAPLLSKAEAEYAGKIAVARVNLAQDADLARQYEIAAAPTLLFFQKGREIARHRGVIDRDGLTKLIESVIN